MGSSLQSGVSCYGRNGKQLQTYHTQNSPLKTNVVLSLEEHNGQIWMGTDGGGIHILNPQTGKISTLRYIPGDRYSLPANSILCLYNDKSNNMWAGSVRNGLINIKEVGMKTYQDVLPGQNYGLSEKTILSIYQDNDNQIWIGTDGGGINLFDPATGKFHHILSTWEEKVASITGMDKNIYWFRYSAKACLSFIKKPTDISHLSLSTTALMIFYVIGKNSQCISKYS